MAEPVGSAGMPQPSTVPMASPIAGAIEQVPVAEARKRRREGWKPVSQEAAKDYELSKELGGPMGAALGVGAGVLRGIPGGLSAVQWALEKFGGRDPTAVARELEAVERNSPVATFAGEMIPYAVGGEALAAVAPGGGVLGATGRAGLEGAVFGGGAALHEAELGDKTLAAEDLAAAIGQGTLLGGSLGLAISGGGRALRGGRERMARALADPGADTAARMAQGALDPKGADIVGKLWSGAAKRMGVGGAEVLEVAGSLTPEGRAMRRYMTRGGEIIEQQSAKLVNALKKAHAAVREGGDRFVGTMKRDQIASVINRDAVELAFIRSRAELAQLASEVDGMVAAGTGEYGRQADLKWLRKRISAVDNRLVKKPGDIVEAYAQLDDLKRDVGKLTTKSASKGAAGLKSTERATRANFDSIYERYRGLLENETLWGKAGAMQREMNAPWTELLDAQRQGRLYQSALEMVPGRFGEKVSRVSEARMLELLKNPTGPRQAEALQGVRDWLQAGQNFTSAAKKNLKFDGAARKTVEGYDAALKEALESLDEINKSGRGLDAMRKLTAGQSDATGVMTALAVGAGGLPMAPLGWLAGVVAHPPRGLRQMAFVDNIVFDRVTRRGAEAVRGLGRQSVKLPIFSTGAALAERERSRVLQEASAGAADAAMSRLAAVQEHVGPVVDEVGVVAQRAADFLAAKAPKTVRLPGLPIMLEIPPSQFEVEKQGRRRRAVDDPLTLLDDVRRGVVTPEAVEAVQTVYPKRFQQMQTDLLREIQKRATKGEMLPYDRARAASLVLGQPVDPISLPHVQSAIQATYAIEREQQSEEHRRTVGESKLAQRFSTRDDLSEAE